MFCRNPGLLATAVWFDKLVEYVLTMAISEINIHSFAGSAIRDVAWGKAIEDHMRLTL
jgi:hypothetical protein